MVRSSAIRMGLATLFGLAPLSLVEAQSAPSAAADVRVSARPPAAPDDTTALAGNFRNPAWAISFRPQRACTDPDGCRAAARMDFCYNLRNGDLAMLKSTVLRRRNAADYESSAKRLEDRDRAGGVGLAGYVAPVQVTPAGFASP
jgi:hypothetical protein